MPTPTKPLAALAAGLALATPGLASDLEIDGRTDAPGPIGNTLDLTLEGGALLPATIALDLDPGPVALFGEEIPLGLTPVFQIVLEASTDANGDLALPLPVPNSPGLIGTTVYFAGVVIDPSDENGLDFSNGASVTFAPPTIDVVELELFGVPRAGAPFFDWVTTAQDQDPIDIAVDPNDQPQLAGLTVDVYVVADRTEAEWNATPALVDVSGDGPDSVTFSATDVAQNTFRVDPGTLVDDGDDLLGVGFDVVIDLDGDGLLGPDDLIDGFSTGAGFYVAQDPSTPGPHPVTEVLYSGGSLLGQNLFYPTNLDDFDQLHLIVVSHGNGHNYQWYDHIGEHMASWGYVVMSHQNNTQPGIFTASTTTLTNTEYFLANLDTIEGGALDGKIIRDEITWIGHSRGGEGIVRAYDRLVDDAFISPEFDDTDIALLSSIAPTVFTGPNGTNPHQADFHLWVGAGDSDVNGCAQSNIAQPHQIFGRAKDQRQATTLYGVGHAWFHNGTGAFINGPCQLSRPRTHEIVQGYFLPLVEWHIRENPAARDFLWRQYEDLRPASILTEDVDPCVVVNLQYTDRSDEGKLVIEAVQGEETDLIASSGVPITTDLDLWVTGKANDTNTTFTDDPADPFNGTIYARLLGPEDMATLTYSGGTDQSLVFDLGAGTDDWEDFGWLSFRAGQVTRHPITDAIKADLHFSVRLVDTDGDSAVLSTQPILAGLEEPYQRSQCGFGIGWHNEVETIRMGLRGFQAENPALDLDELDRLEFLFGPSWGDAEGRLLIDDVEVHVD